MIKSFYSDPKSCVKDVIQKIGNEVNIAVPLGLGKPIQLLNALYKHAKANPEFKLTILTALSLCKPKITNKLAKRLVDPIAKKLFDNYVDLEYEIDRRKQSLPDNVKVIEFYFSPGEYLENNKAQQDYICSNYTFVIRDILKYKLNVVGQLIACDGNNRDKFSLSGNADLTRDLLNIAKNEYSDDSQPILLGEINENLPYMDGGKDVEFEQSEFAAIIDNQNNDRDLFVIPRPQVNDADFLIGFYTSLLIKDNGTLQIGIGGASDALVYSLILRHKNNEVYKELIKKLNIEKKYQDLIEYFGGKEPFRKGLFASTEMLVDGYLDLYENGILKKKTYDDLILQKLINENKISDSFDETILEILIENEAIGTSLSEKDVLFLQHFGIFHDENILKYDKGDIVLNSSKRIKADLENKNNIEKIIENCLGNHLKNGYIAHAGFFIGSRRLYKSLNQLDKNERNLFNMRSVSKINQLYNSEEIDKLQRLNGRFVNSALKVTLMGAVVSDGLENGKIISGVGGQYNFVAMAHELEGARAIINCQSSRTRQGKRESNILWNYGHTTIARHLRDIVVTEYGIADCRSKTDSDVIKNLLNISDSQFQEKLLEKAKKSGKIPKDYKIPEIYKNNHSETISKILKPFKEKKFFNPYPFGTSLTEEEIILKDAINFLKSKSTIRQIFLAIKGIFIISNEKDKKLLIRMKLDKLKSVKEYIYRCIILSAIRNVI